MIARDTISGDEASVSFLTNGGPTPGTESSPCAESFPLAREAPVPPLLASILLLQPWLPLIVAATTLAVVAAALFTRYAIAPQYRAEAVLRPTLSETQGVGLLESLAAGLGHVGGSLQDGPRHDPHEFIAIMNSYAFVLGVVDQHSLTRLLVDRPSPRWFGPRRTRYARWTLVWAMRSRFDSVYNFKESTLTLHFLDRDPAVAERILGCYISNLRNKLRAEEAKNAGAAAASLQEEAGRTSDVMLQTELYDMIAHEIRRQKTALVQADFAFSVIEPPVTPDHPYGPSMRQNLLFAATGTPLLLVLAILGFDYLSLLREHLKAARARTPRAEPLNKHLGVGSQVECSGEHAAE